MHIYVIHWRLLISFFFFFISLPLGVLLQIRRERESRNLCWNGKIFNINFRCCLVCKHDDDVCGINLYSLALIFHCQIVKQINNKLTPEFMDKIYYIEFIYGDRRRQITYLWRGPFRNRHTHEKLRAHLHTTTNLLYFRSLIFLLFPLLDDTHCVYMYEWRTHNETRSSYEKLNFKWCKTALI